MLAWRLRRDGARRDAVALFHYSLAYLALLFVAAAIDPFARVMLDPELARRNNRLGLALFGLFVALFLGTILVALIYLQLD